MKVVAMLAVLLALAGCALFGVLSFSKNGGKEVIEVNRSITKKVNEELKLDDETVQAINTTWEEINPMWKADFTTYTKRYNTLVMANAMKEYPAKSLFVAVIKRTMVLKGFQQLHNLNYEDFTAVLAFPDGADSTVYWFLINGGFPLLGFTLQDFQYQTVP